MNSNNKEPLKDFLSGRTNLIEISLIAIFTAFGVSITVSSITSYDWYNALIGIIVGCIFCFGSITYLIIRNIYKIKFKKHTYQGFIVYNKNNSRLVDIPRYDFGHQIYDKLKYAFNENSALQKIWENSELGCNYEFSKEKNGVIKKRCKSNELLCEVVEYYLLSKLSFHLTDYFNKSTFNKEDLYVFERQEIPDVLFSNRFLELFSKPRENRPHFVKNTLEKNDYNGEIVMSLENGAFYEKFKLILPKNTTIERINKNKIKIDTKKFKMEILISFVGLGAVLPKGFKKYYLNFNNLKDIKVYQINIDININFKFNSLFSMNGWKYYKWVDSFLNKLNKDIEQNYFFDSINWDSTLTAIKCFKNINNFSQEEVAEKKHINDN